MCWLSWRVSIIAKCALSLVRLVTDTVTPVTCDICVRVNTPVTCDTCDTCDYLLQEQEASLLPDVFDLPLGQPGAVFDALPDAHTLVVCPAHELDLETWQVRRCRWHAWVSIVFPVGYI